MLGMAMKRGVVGFWVAALVVMLSLTASRGSRAQNASSLPAALALDSPPPAAVAGPSNRTPIKMDPDHPLHIGEEFYPAESRRLNEEGTCVVRVQVSVDGRIRAVQLIQSTGFDRLNSACLSAFVDGRLIPATVGGKVVSAWANVPIIWKLSGRSFASSPQIRDDFELEVGRNYYPAAAVQAHQEGDCLVRVTVSAAGTARDVVLGKSTGFAELDQASLHAVKDALFIPARNAIGMTIDASTEIVISWRLQPQ